MRAIRKGAFRYKAYAPLRATKYCNVSDDFYYAPMRLKLCDEAKKQCETIFGLG